MYTSMGVTLDFHKEGAQRCVHNLRQLIPRLSYVSMGKRRLTEALLHRDFGLQWNIPENRICPPVSLAVNNDIKGLVFCIDLPVPCQVPNRCELPYF